MEKEQKVYLELSHDLKKFLGENSIDLQEALELNGYQVTQEINPFPTEEGYKTRDFLLVLSIAIGAKLVIPELVKLLRFLTGKDKLIAYEAERLLLDREGKPVKDSDGNFRTTKVKIHNSGGDSQELKSFEFGLKKIKFSFAEESDPKSKSDKESTKDSDK